MDFAKKILGKYGWKEGDGLGKNNNGIAAPLKASYKFDNAGLGVDRATEFNDHWWERCFNDAASNVSVEVKQNGQVSTARKAGEEAVEISTKGYSARKLQKAKEQQRDAEGGAVYEHFLKSAMLTQTGGEVANTERIQAKDIAVTQVQVLTDEQLFKACGGRTAHKGARHGLKLSGKLARVEQQEREMLAKLLGKQKAVQEVNSTASKDNQMTQKESEDELEPTAIKKKKRNMDKLESRNVKKSETQENEKVEPTSSKKKKGKNKVEIEEESETQEKEDVAEKVEPTSNKKKKRKGKLDPEQEVKSETQSAVQPEEVELSASKKKKRSRDEKPGNALAIKLEEKKNKRKQELDAGIENISEFANEENCQVPVKSKKKKNKEKQAE